jgi:hypothetical protein
LLEMLKGVPRASSIVGRPPADLRVRIVCPVVNRRRERYGGVGRVALMALGKVKDGQAGLSCIVPKPTTLRQRIVKE